MIVFARCTTRPGFEVVTAVERPYNLGVIAGIVHAGVVETPASVLDVDTRYPVFRG
jgi:hypothetical protein